MSDARALTLRILSEGRISADEAVTLLTGLAQPAEGASPVSADSKQQRVVPVGESLPVSYDAAGGPMAPGQVHIIHDNNINIFSPF
jgi:hypothetical protein